MPSPWISKSWPSSISAPSKTFNTYSWISFINWDLLLKLYIYFGTQINEGSFNGWISPGGHSS